MKELSYKNLRERGDCKKIKMNLLSKNQSKGQGQGVVMIWWGSLGIIIIANQMNLIGIYKYLQRTSIFDMFRDFYPDVWTNKF